MLYSATLASHSRGCKDDWEFGTHSTGCAIVLEWSFPDSSAVIVHTTSYERGDRTNAALLGRPQTKQSSARSYRRCHSARQNDVRAVLQDAMRSCAQNMAYRTPTPTRNTDSFTGPISPLDIHCLHKSVCQESTPGLPAQARMESTALPHITTAAKAPAELCRVLRSCPWTLSAQPGRRPAGCSPTRCRTTPPPSPCRRLRASITVAHQL